MTPSRLLCLLSFTLRWVAGKKNEVCDTSDQIDDPKLRALLADNSVDDTTLVMLTNEGYLDFTFNAICSLQQLQMHKFVVIATDAGAFESLQDARVPCYFNKSLTGEIEGTALDLKDNVDSYRRIVLLKLRLLQQLISEFSVILSDVDVVWLENALPELAASHPDSPDLLFLWDGPNDNFMPEQMNAGFFRLRSNPQTRSFVARLVQSVEARETWKDFTLEQMTDQHYWNKFLSEGADVAGITFSTLNSDNFLVSASS